MPIREFREWQIYEQIEPFGDRRADFQVAMLMTLVANLARTSKDDREWKISDFLYDWDALPPEPQTVEQQLQMMTLLQACQNAIVARQESVN